MDCDKWPPAVSQQALFSNKPFRNSLRCIPASENRSLGAKNGNFINARGGPYPGRPSGPMNEDDHFKMEFDISKADQIKLRFCKPQPNCANDGLQLEMRRKSSTNNNDKMSSLYDHVLQCSVEMTRDGAKDFKSV
ncbi:hypothetical protein UCREL1_1979 [Eutypa lata UCREL1]|uniref:Uncharacterized protein n=1 Tax=Eutypa lata (strain UCR-EL1) TaxID=1287681 RepID=M7T346_EUTLA|nr:hypothetical protein UCREL1_1979 [Eutypa lata UCREL1]